MERGLCRAGTFVTVTWHVILKEGSATWNFPIVTSRLNSQIADIGNRGGWFVAPLQEAEVRASILAATCCELLRLAATCHELSPGSRTSLL